VDRWEEKGGSDDELLFQHLKKRAAGRRVECMGEKKNGEGKTCSSAEDKAWFHPFISPPRWRQEKGKTSLWKKEGKTQEDIINPLRHHGQRGKGKGRGRRFVNLLYVRSREKGKKKKVIEGLQSSEGGREEKGKGESAFRLVNN